MRHSTPSPRMQAGIRLMTFLGYVQRSQYSSSTISIHGSKHFVKINIGCQHPSAEVTLTYTENTERHNAIYCRIFLCEIRMLMALMC